MIAKFGKKKINEILIQKGLCKKRDAGTVPGYRDRKWQLLLQEPFGLGIFAL